MKALFVGLGSWAKALKKFKNIITKYQNYGYRHSKMFNS